MTENLHTKLAELRTRHASEIDKAARAQARADETRARIDALLVVIRDVLGEQVGDEESPPPRARRRKQGDSATSIVGRIAAKMPGNFEAEDVADEVAKEHPEQSISVDAVRKILGRLARDGTIGIARPGRPRRPAAYRAIAQQGGENESDA